MKFELRDDPKNDVIRLYSNIMYEGKTGTFCGTRELEKVGFIICEVDDQGYVKLNKAGIGHLGLRVRE
jgi:hypothetical protein